jgi:predicted alpha/beta superfamily hydrolase
VSIPRHPRPGFVLSSPQTGTDYPIYLDVPAEQPGPWPAVVFLDGDDQFRFAAQAAHQATAAGDIPPTLLVGVGYGASYTKPGNRRVRDYTPTAVATEEGSGGAEPFLRFLTDTLWPELTRRHPVREEVRGLAGHSLGALLVLHALFRRNPFFNRCLASAPSLWWDNRALMCGVQNLQATGIALPARLFLGVGEKDSASTLADLDQFETQLTTLPFPHLAVVSHSFPARDHYNVLPDSFGAGLKALLGS